ncbi:unnamed protein product [Nesidiocoris tenuis]|uniref:APCDD1 domain-containing protein n=1 Tax=Nesidiocoris tenuis TaxID=355587 RepID=A0A6H5FXE1_9HEMI|nr:unnamed protein product [Nesidiocoris tenuis]
MRMLTIKRASKMANANQSEYMRDNIQQVSSQPRFAVKTTVECDSVLEYISKSFHGQSVSDTSVNSLVLGIKELTQGILKEIQKSRKITWGTGKAFEVDADGYVTDREYRYSILSRGTVSIQKYRCLMRIDREAYRSPFCRVQAVQDFCAICKKVLKSALLEPPHIRHSTALPIHLSGEWVSMRCEIKHMALFVKRRFKVAGDRSGDIFYVKFNVGQEWRAEYEFYTDALCMKRTLMAVAEGDFLPAADVSDVRVLGAKDYDFRVVGVSLTAYERGVVASLEEDGRCGRNWQVNVSKNLKPTKGCPALGIKIPTTEYELIRIEQDGAGNAVLFLGQSEDRADEAKKRPTYFQPGMIQCSNVETPLTHFLNSYTNGSSAVRCFSIVTVALATAILASCT